MEQPLRVLVSPVNIANDPWALTRALRGLGVEADLATVNSRVYLETGDYDLEFPGQGTLTKAFKKARFVAWASRHYDVFHYVFAHSILEYSLPGAMLLDVRLMRALGKPILMSFRGCEARNAFTDKCRLGCPECDRSVAKRRRMELALRLADHAFVSTPDLLLDVPSAQWMPQCVETAGHSASVPPSVSGPLRVLHAPSHRGIKGTEHVLAACQQLESEGLGVELRLVEDTSHAEALSLYEWADVAVDQLLLGWYGVFAVELMAMGKPVVCRIDPEFVRLSGLPEPPLIGADPGTLVAVLRKCHQNRVSLRRHRRTVSGLCRENALP